MYDFHYEHFKKWYPNANLLFTDTDSLVYHIFTDDLYADLAAHREYFDFSGYPDDHFLFSNANKMVVGKMKDESAGGIITEYVGLRPKMYSYTTKPVDEDEPPKEAKRAKGIQKAAINDLHHADYLAQLKRGAENYVNVRRIGQKHHRVFTIEGVKRGLCAFDDKRYLLADGINTMAHGHYAIRNEQTQEFDEPMPESAMSTSFSPYGGDEENVDVTGFITLSHEDSVRQGLHPHITRGEVFAMIGGTDLRREIDELASTRNAAVHNDDDDDDNERPHHAYHMIDDGDDVDDDANDVEDLLSIIDVAIHTGMTDPF
jgi:hypothetical protein